MTSGLYVGLPGEFASPTEAGARLAAIGNLAERQDFLDQRIPAAWRGWVIDEAAIFLACAMVDGGMTIEERRAAIAEVPRAWRELVEGHVRRLWRTREIRAAYRAQIASKRADQAAEAA